MTRKPSVPPSPRRRLQGDHRAVATGRSSIVRRDRKSRRALRGRGAPAGPAPDRRRRHAGGRRHRPPGARLRATGDGRDPRHQAARPVADQLAALDEVDYVVVTAGSYDILAEVVCESDEALLGLISGRIRAIEGVAATETFMYLQLRKQTYSWGCPLSTSPWSRIAAARDDRGRLDARRATLPGDTDVDVAVVGAGSPASGRPTTSRRPTLAPDRGAGGGGVAGTARPAATAAGARRCSPPPWTS